MKRKWPILLLFPLLLLAVCLYHPWGQPSVPPWTQDQYPRAAFARAMEKIDRGTSAATVVRLLGQPDDIRTLHDPDSFGFGQWVPDGTTEIWRYGTSGRLTFATLGTVFLGNGTVQMVGSGTGQPPPPGMFGEAELRDLLRAIDAAGEPWWNDEGYNPLTVIQAVNILQPLGKAKCIAAIEEYRRVKAVDSGYHPFDGNLFAILQLLFEVPNDAKGFEVPVTLVDDIPLDLNHGISLSGSLGVTDETIRYYQQNGEWRTHPLVPPDDPLGTLDKLVRSPQWTYKDEPGSDSPANMQKSAAANQLLALVDTVYRIADGSGNRLQIEFTPEKWDKIVKEVAALHIHWDGGKNRYVFADGTSLPDVKPPVYERRIVQLPGMGEGSILVAQRKNDDSVSIDFRCSEPAGTPLPKTVVKIYRAGDERASLAEIDLSQFAPPDTNASYSLSTSSDLTGVPPGAGLEAWIITEGETTKTTVFTP